MDDRTDRFCLVLQQYVPEVECYETVLGCVDTIVYKRTVMPYEQVREICQKCPYSNID